MKEATFERHKEPYDEKFTTVPNRLIVDNNLTDSDFRLLMYLFSNSETWKVYIGHTRKILGWGKEKMEKTIDHIIKLGYVHRTLVREKGKFSHYKFQYHHKPIYLGMSEEEPKIAVQASQPKAGFPPTAHKPCEPTAVKPPAVNRPLPMPNLPMPKALPLKGNACHSTNKTLGSFLQGFGQALPSSIEDEAVEALDKPTFTVIPSVTRKFQRKKEHQEAFEWLMSLGLTDENNCVSEDEMSYLTHCFPLTKLQDAYCHLLYKQAHQDFKPKSVIAIFKFLLKNEANLKGRNVEMNTGFAHVFKNENKWHSLEIKSDYVQDKNFPGKDISMNMETDSFAFSLQNLYSSLTRARTYE